MIRTSPFAKLVSAVLFTAVCAYALAHLMQFAENGRTEILTEKTVTDSITLEGIALRSEQPVCLEGEPVFFCKSGKRVAAKHVIAKCGGNDLISSESALFFDNCDGYEYLSISEETFSPERLRELLCAEKQNETAVGRLVTGRNWYFAATADAQSIPCGESKVKFDGSDEAVNASLVRSCPDGEGKTAILLKIRIGKNEYLSLRRCGGEIIRKEITGLAVSKKAVSEDSGGNTFVIKRTVKGESSCPVDIIYNGEDFFLIKPTDELYNGAKVKIQP